MPVQPDTGNQATVAFADSGFTAKLKSMGGLDQSIEKLDASALDTVDQKEYIPGDLMEPGEIEFEFFWDTEELPPDPGVIDTITVTFPEREGEATPASFTASGFFTGRVTPTFKNNELQMGKVKFQLDGRETKFTYTAATATP
jgi:hypothetical protein